MKLNGIVGKGSGKLGASVFAISGGEQIVRQYNPQVSNPSTDAQVAQRAKLKLMSQLAAALAPGLGFKKIGLVSARNQFVSKNIGLASFTDGTASVTIELLQLTPGTIVGPYTSIARPAQGTNLSVDLSNDANKGFEKIVLVSVERVSEDNLKVLEVKIETASNGAFPAAVSIAGTENAGTVFAYGVVAGSSKNKGIYGNTAVDDQELSAELDTSIMNSIRNASLSLTVGTNVDAL